MGLFGAIVRTAVNAVILPVAAVKDVVTLGGVITDEPSAFVKAVERLKKEADEDED